jgi:predicted lipid-binding transport protein (Tim44 family)
MGGAVPLSEHEQRQLEQIEQALYTDYPKLAQAVRAKDPRIHYKRRVVQAAIGFLLGVGLLLAGVVSKVIFVGVGGFVVMLACAMWALTSWRHMGGAAAGRSASATSSRGPSGTRSQRQGRKARKDRRRGRAGGGGGGFMERLEERWRRRQEGDR